MKRTALVLSLLIVASAISSFVTYHITHRADYTTIRVSYQGQFVGAMDALEKIRAGQPDDGTRRIESLCFFAACILYGDPNCREYLVTKSFAVPLIHYRDTYRTNRVEWTPAEETLERDLASWR